LTSLDSCRVICDIFLYLGNKKFLFVKGYFFWSEADSNTILLYLFS